MLSCTQASSTVDRVMLHRLYKDYPESEDKSSVLVSFSCSFGALQQWIYCKTLFPNWTLNYVAPYLSLPSLWLVSESNAHVLLIQHLSPKHTCYTFITRPIFCTVYSIFNFNSNFFYFYIKFEVLQSKRSWKKSCPNFTFNNSRWISCFFLHKILCKKV